MSQPIYLDYAAATPIDARVIAAMQPFYAEKFYNPSGLYLAAKEVKTAVNQARSQVAQVLGAKPSEIIFTAGGTEANNLAINGIMDGWPKNSLLMSAIEHESVLEPATQYSCQTINVDKQGIVDIDDLLKKLTDKTVLVSVMYANNEIGSVQPLKDVAAAIKTIKRQRLSAGSSTPLYFHSDAAQAVNYLDIHPDELGVDLMTLNGSKIYGPKQVGCLYIKSGTKLSSQILGGGQERNLRSGTENVAGIVGFAEALKIATKRKKTEAKRQKALQHQFIDGLQAKLPDVAINGSMKHRLPNNVHVTLPGFDNERLLMELDERGIMCATGSACSASSDEPSHVLKAIGLSDELARSSLRFTLGEHTLSNDIDNTVKALKQICL